MEYTKPTREQAEAIFKSREPGPVVFVNLNKYSPEGGAEAYAVYLEKFDELMSPRGVEVVYHGTPLLTAVGPIDWDEVIVVRYPSLQVWKDMVMSDAYQAMESHRGNVLMHFVMAISLDFSA